MRKLILKIVKSRGANLCAFALALASISPACCRGVWYQPEEPEGFEDFVKSEKHF